MVVGWDPGINLAEPVGRSNDAGLPYRVALLDRHPQHLQFDGGACGFQILEICRFERRHGKAAIVGGDDKAFGCQTLERRTESQNPRPASL